MCTAQRSLRVDVNVDVDQDATDNSSNADDEALTTIYIDRTTPCNAHFIGEAVEDVETEISRSRARKYLSPERRCRRLLLHPLTNQLMDPPMDQLDTSNAKVESPPSRVRVASHPRLSLLEKIHPLSVNMVDIVLDQNGMFVMAGILLFAFHLESSIFSFKSLFA